MQNNNPNNFFQEDEIDLKELFKFLINSKKLLITITLVITTLGAIYSFQKTQEFKSIAFIEIGNYYDLDSNSLKSIEPADTLIEELKINYFLKKQIFDIDEKDLEFNLQGGRIIEILAISTSSVKSEKIVNEILKFIQNRHLDLITDKVLFITNEINFQISKVNDKIEFKKEKEEKLIKLTKDIFDPKEGFNLEILTNSYDIFLLSQRKKTLEFNLEYLSNPNIIKTKLAKEIVTINSGLKKEIIILFSFIFGLFLSIVMVLINKALKDFNET
jgi:LPS O-antigen subunit length determinant protein (WzzB/FepE family)